MDFISFDPRLITENNLHDNNRPHRYKQNIQEQQKLFTNNDNYDEDQNNNEEYMFENQNENRNEDIALHMNENNASEYTTPESTTSAQNTSQTGTSTKTQFVTIPTRIVSSRQNTHDPQSCLDTSPLRNITFNFLPHPDEVVQDETQNIPSIHETSVNVLSPTRTISNNTRNITRSIYDPPSLPSAFKHSNKTIQPENNRNINQQISSQHYDPFNYSFFPPSNTNLQTNDNQNVSQSNNNTILMTHHTYANSLQTNSSQSNFPPQNQRTSYSNLVQSSQKRSQNPPPSHISTEPLYQMNQHTIYNPTTISPPVNMVQSVVPPSQYMPIQQDTFITT